MSFNPETVKILSGLLELLEEVIESLEKDVKKSGENPHSFFNADKYTQLIKKYYSITNLNQK
jgi:hypothetical protein